MTVIDAHAMFRSMFCRYVLRTTDPVAARAFYADALGLVLPDGMSEGSALESWALHERAIARGAPPHWLGQIAVSDVEATIEHLLARGSEPLGPGVQAQDGTPFATVRDPFGSVVGVCGREAKVKDSPVVWHQLHTSDLEGSWALYSELFGWSLKQSLDVAEPVGGYRLFAWSEASPIVGGMGNTARQLGVHQHWLFCFEVTDIDEAIARVRTLRGTAMKPFALPDGMRVAGCEDPQGAAFGVAQRA
ncbi:MAG: VOC family protein [Myxococcota bacterium]